MVWNSTQGTMEELKMVKVRGRGKRKPRSLVYKFSRSKAMAKDDTAGFDSSLKDNSLSLGEGEKCSTSVDLPSSSLASNGNNKNGEIESSSDSKGKEKLKSPLKLKLPKSALPTSETKPPELRRTSRRIILRVRKDFLETDVPKVGRKKRMKKAQIHPTGPLKKKRGPGRPPKVREVDVPVLKVNKKELPTASRKSITLLKPAQKVTRSSGVWTLVPKELLESEFFKNHVMQVQVPIQKMKAPRNAKAVFLSHVRPVAPPPVSPTFQPKRKRMEVKFPPQPAQPASAHWHKSQAQRQKASTRPTVIYFKGLKNDLNVQAQEEKKGIVEEPPTPFGEFKNNQQNDLFYLYSRYPVVSKTTLQYIYDVSKGNISETEHWLNQMFSGKQLLVPQQDGYPQFINSSTCPYSGSMAKVSKINNDDSNVRCVEICGTLNSYANDSDAVTRCLIVESMKLLYDSEAVLC